MKIKNYLLFSLLVITLFSCSDDEKPKNPLAKKEMIFNGQTYAFDEAIIINEGFNSNGYFDLYLKTKDDAEKFIELHIRASREWDKKTFDLTTEDNEFEYGYLISIKKSANTDAYDLYFHRKSHLASGTITITTVNESKMKFKIEADIEVAERTLVINYEDVFEMTNPL
jgi:hypothetical protein